MNAKISDSNLRAYGCVGLYLRETDTSLSGRLRCHTDDYVYARSARE